jgi:hypothetical protein
MTIEHEQMDQAEPKQEEIASDAVEAMTPEPVEVIAPDSASAHEGEIVTSTQPADEAEFDPAVDMPMYRQGMDWFVLRVASNKET